MWSEHRDYLSVYQAMCVCVCERERERERGAKEFPSDQEEIYQEP